MICKKCRKYVTDKSLFCNYCGNKIQTECPHCGKLLSADSRFCNYCGTRLQNIPVTHDYDDIPNFYDIIHRERNPILNSPDDITDELIEKILENDLDSLTINYEFTRCSNEGSNEDYDKWKNEQNRNNPFWRANSITPIKRIEFEVRLGPGVHSLACAFQFFEKLEYVNIKDTSNVTRMDAMFVGAPP